MSTARLPGGIFPSLSGIFLASAIVVPFTVAALSHDVTPCLPFISEISQLTPEGNILIFFLTLSAFTGLVTVCHRYLLVQAFCEEYETEVAFLNRLTMGAGLGSTAGMVVMASFPAHTIHKLHIAGYCLWMFGGVVHILLQAFLTFAMYPRSTGLRIGCFRLLLAVASLIAIVTSYVMWLLGEETWIEAWHRHGTSQRDPTDRGFSAYLVSGCAEWVTILCIIIFNFSYIRDFQKVPLEARMIPLVSHLQEDVTEQEWLLYRARS
jgi:hypothetical protein